MTGGRQKWQWETDGARRQRKAAAGGRWRRQREAEVVEKAVTETRQRQIEEAAGGRRRADGVGGYTLRRHVVSCGNRFVGFG